MGEASSYLPKLGRGGCVVGPHIAPHRCCVDKELIHHSGVHADKCSSNIKGSEQGERVHFVLAGVHINHFGSGQQARVSVHVQLQLDLRKLAQVSNQQFVSWRTWRNIASKEKTNKKLWGKNPRLVIPRL